MNRKKKAALSGALALALGLGACASGTPQSDADVTLRYWLWDSSQLPGYRQCAENFQADNPDIFISMEQYGWDDYWTQLTAALVAENAPDVFTNHTSRFGRYATLDQLLDLSDYIERDDYDLTQFQEGLPELWKTESGSGQLGIPKDWDTVGLFYNEEMVEEAGYTEEDLWELEWNPEDGGTYEEFLAAMTIDANGVHGNEPGFDSNNVVTYGIGYNEAGSGYGQVQWSPYPLSNGWDYADENPWGRVFNYDDPNFQESIEWWQSLIGKGYM
ncbi:MAG: ABC transporter substrate-binding protein, partial [Ancrocorticia sp.]